MSGARFVAAAAAIGLASRGVPAQSVPPEGLPAGPWILAPLLVVGASYESNVLYQAPAEDPLSDELIRGRVALAAYLPFRSSLLQLSAHRDWRDYRTTQLVGPNTADEFRADLGLHFSTEDRLNVRGNLTNGIADTSVFDPGGEAVFRGEPFRYWEIGTQLARESPGRRGYDVQWAWRSLAFDLAEQQTGFYNYDGWSGSAQYREPLSASAWVVATYETRRYDHVCFGLDVDGLPCPGEAAPFRQEKGDAVLAGLRGTLSGQRPYSVQVGWGALRFDGGASSDFRGAVVDAELRLRTAASSRLDLSFHRRPWASFYTFNDYYLSTYGEIRYEIDLPTGMQAGLKVTYVHSAYPDPSPIAAEGALARRIDDTLRAEAYANLHIRQRLGLRGSVLQMHRNSTDPIAEYDALTVFLGMFYGWY